MEVHVWRLEGWMYRGTEWQMDFSPRSFSNHTLDKIINIDNKTKIGK